MPRRNDKARGASRGATIVSDGAALIVGPRKPRYVRVGTGRIRNFLKRNPRLGQYRRRNGALHRVADPAI